MKQYIGGFFEAEKNLTGKGPFHSGAKFLSTGRACFNLILKTIKPVNVYVPFLTCDALIEPLRINDIAFTFYGLDEFLNPIELPSLNENEFVVYINYFGLKSKTAKDMALRLGKRLVVDNTQAFFEPAYDESPSFNSARKSFGVPDGAYLYFSGDEKVLPRNENITTTHLDLRATGRQEDAFLHFRQHEGSLGSEILMGSEYSESILNRIPYSTVAQKRKTNYAQYQKAFRSRNILQIDSRVGSVDEIPFCYPLLLDIEIDRTVLFEKNIFTPLFWPDVLSRMQNRFLLEKKISKNVIHLPVDHRYGEEEIDYVIRNVERFYK